jgi:hypothetical protein
MQLLIDTADIAEAPVEVRLWLARTLDLGRVASESRVAPESRVASESHVAADSKVSLKSDAETVSEPIAQVKAAKEKAKAEANKDVSVSELLNKAVELIESKGEDVLAEILKKLGIDRVKNCPEDKRAALLAEIAIHA